MTLRKMTRAETIEYYLDQLEAAHAPLDVAEVIEHAAATHDLFVINSVIHAGVNRVQTLVEQLQQHDSQEPEDVGADRWRAETSQCG